MTKCLCADANKPLPEKILETGSVIFFKLLSLLNRGVNIVRTCVNLVYSFISTHMHNILIIFKQWAPTIVNRKITPQSNMVTF